MGSMEDSPSTVQPEDGPLYSYQGVVLSNLRAAPFDKDGIGAGRVPSFLFNPQVVAVDNIPSTATTTILATAAAVTQAGAIGFVGLIVPHLVRLAVGNDQRLLLAASALAGGSLLVIADTLARAIIAPQQLPVGVLTALIGVPVFLFLLTRDPQAGR